MSEENKDLGDKADDAAKGAKESAKEFAKDAKESAKEFTEDTKEAAKDFGQEAKKRLMNSRKVWQGPEEITKNYWQESWQ